MPSADLNVPENRDLSPLTGWTRDHWMAAVERMVAGVLPCVDRRTGLPHLAGDPDETALAAQLVNPGGVIEALERTMMLVAAHVAATGRTTVPGYEGDIAEPYRKGMLHFIDPASPEYRRVSFGSGIVLAALVAPEAFIDPLTDAERDLLREHLSRFIQRPTYNTSNTLLFAMMPTALVLRLGGSYDRDQMADRMDAILSMYRGDGWFIDGWNQGFDHYNFWGFQLYLHALVHFDPWLRDRYAARVREITLAHEETLPYLFGRDGGPIPKGRSLNYRFASISGIAFAQLSGLSGMHPGLARRISSGCLKYFWDHGCLSERGLLEPGYWGANSAIGEDYTDRGAPYWASTGLMSLALPPDHEFWTAVEQPLAADGPDVRRKLVRGGRMILKADGPRGEARMITVGEPFRHRKVWQAGTKYFQHAYSSSLGHALAGDLGPELAAGRTGMSRDGKVWAYRTWPRAVSLDAERATSEWDAWAAVEGMTGSVVTETIVLDRGEVHVFHHTADEPHYLTVGGYSVAADHGERATMDIRDGGLAAGSRRMWSVLQILNDVRGVFAMEEVRPRPGFKHSHLFGGWAAFPRWTSKEPVAPGVRVAVFVDAARKDESPQVEVPTISCHNENDAMVIEVEGRTWRL